MTCGVNDSADEADKLARSFCFLRAEEVVVQYSKFEVRRCGFRVTHAHCLTSTGSQGLTLRSGTAVDCARLNELDDELVFHRMNVEVLSRRALVFNAKRDLVCL